MSEKQPDHVEQSRYKKHNTSKRCTCVTCLQLRRFWPRLASTIDGEIEQVRRVTQYKEGNYS